MTIHYSVLLQESIDLLDIKPDGIYVDCTFGRGGHSSEILSKLSKNGRLIAFDKDLDAIAYGEGMAEARFSLIHASFANIGTKLQNLGITSVDGILADLGVSSPQLDDQSRGFSFRFNSKLDMRMDTTIEYSAYHFVNLESEELIVKVLFEYGEEKFARKIARRIISHRAEHIIETTQDLADIVRLSIPYRLQDKNPAIRTFQAIRIYVNKELIDLESLLNLAPKLLNKKGRFVVISFHSLEDRLVKKQFNSLSSVESLPKWVMENAKDPEFRLISKKLKATQDEVFENPRSRSAILRAIEKC